jgi:hypothetical protein
MLRSVALSNGAKYVYYSKANSDGEYSLYVRKGTEDTKLGAYNNYSSVYLNRDGSQMIYHSDDKACLSVNGGDKQSLRNSVDELLVPSGTQTSFARSYVYGISDFRNTFYTAYDSEFGAYAIIRINGDYETERVARNIASATLCNDGKTLIYRKDDSLYKIDGLKQDAEEIELVDGDVAGFDAAENGGAVYYVTTDDEAYYLKGTGKAKLISSDVQPSEYGGYQIAYYDNAGLFYYVSDDTLYSSKNGGKGAQVKGINGDVITLGAGTFAVSVRTTDDGDTLYYRSKDGKTFELVATEEY